MRGDVDFYGGDNHIKKGFRNIVGLNSTSFMAGASKVWTSEKTALEGPRGNSPLFGVQDFSDGQLEFVSFRSELELGLEKVMPGQSSKLAQGAGPFMIHFKHTPDTNVQTFFQIDGENFKVHNPRHVKICKTEKIKGSQIKVMYRNAS